MSEPIKHTPCDLKEPGCDRQRLRSMAFHAPHDCTNPTCPGAVNKRKIAALDRLMDVRKRAHEESADFELQSLRIRFEVDTIARAEAAEGES